jgi:hypothetical protein
MTHREQLIQELQATPDILIKQLLDYLHRLQEQEKQSPFAQFIEILSDEEAEEIQVSIKENCRQVDPDEQ